MSKCIRSEFGTLGDRLSAQYDPEAIPPPTTVATPGNRWVLIDNLEEALLAKWRKGHDEEWEGLVARVGGADDLWAEWVPVSRLTPHRL